MSRSVSISLKSLVLLLSAFWLSAHAADGRAQRFDIPGQELAAALKQFAVQSDLEILFVPEDAAAKRTAGVQGEHEPTEALRILLTGTGLQYRVTSGNSIVIESQQGASGGRAESGMRLTQVAAYQSTDVQTNAGPNQDKRRSAQRETAARDVPEILVEGSRVLNMDIQRTRDDIQPYVIFDAATIERSGATSLNDFFKQRLPMNTNAINSNQERNVLGNMSSVNLRGLGIGQTLILVDGKRQSSISFGGTINQPDLNGIPLAAIERIEVLPTTASGIYGGSAIGGVVNVILRRDYDATEVRLKYGNSFDTGGGVKQADMTLGRSWRSSKTNVLLSANWNEDEGLRLGERDFLTRGRAAIQANNPSYFLSTLPLGSTPNIRSSNGSPLFGPGTASFTSVPAGYAGGGGLAPLQTNAGRLNLDLADTTQSNAAGALMRSPGSVRSATATLRNEFTPRLSGFLELAFSDNKVTQPAAYFSLGSVTLSATAPNNPFNQSVVVSIPVRAQRDTYQNVEQRRVAAGLIARLPGSWTGEIDYSLNRAYSELSTAGQATTITAALGAGAVDILKDTITFTPNLETYKQLTLNNYRSTTENLTLRVAGPIGELPAGRPSLTAIVERRENSFGDKGAERRDSGAGTPLAVTAFWEPGTQDIDSVYVELAIPLVSARNSLPGIRELEMQLAGRHDRYVTVSGPLRVPPGSAPPAMPELKLDSTDPTVGLRWSPLEDVTVRSSWGTGFLPPDTNQIGVPAGPFPGGAGPIIDPRRGNSTNSTYLGIFARTPNLAPEESKSLSVGVVLTPRVLKDLRVSVDYTRIKKTDAILSYPQLSPAMLLANEDKFPGRVLRGPADGLYPVGPVTFLDLTNLNASRVHVKAYDLQADYTVYTKKLGEFGFFALATKQTEYLVQPVPSLPFTNFIDTTHSFPLEWKGNLGFNWQLRQWSGGWTMRYFDSYFVADPAVPASAVTFANQGGQKVQSQAYHDLYLAYRLASGTKLLSNAQVQLGINNVFNEKPPLDLSFSTGYYSPFGDPNLASYSLSFKMSL